MANVSIGPSENSTTLSVAVVSSTATSIAAVAAPSAAAQILRIYKLFLTVGGTTNITFEDGTTPLSGALQMVANGSIVLDNDGQPWFPCSHGNAFTIGNSGGALVTGTVYYTQQNF